MEKTNALTYECNYKEIFENSLITTKVGAIFLFLLTTLIYQIRFAKTKSTSTLFNSLPTAQETLLVSFGSALLSTLSVIYVGFSRGWDWCDIFMASLIVFVILFLFEISTESSGFNRFLNSEETAKHKGIYYELDKRLDKNYDQDENIRSNDAGSPFVISTFNLVFIVLILFVFHVVWKMSISTFYGLMSGKTDVDNVTFFGGSLSPTSGFGLELLVMLLLNGASQIIPNALVEQKLTSSTYMMSALFGIGSVFFHLAFQYSGGYNSGELGC